MFDRIHQIPTEEVAQIKWLGNDLYYDLQLYELGSGHKEFYVVNPNNDYPEQWRLDLKYYVEEVPTTRKCIVITHNNDWIVKIFKDGWYPYHGYESVEIVKTELAWTRNPDIDKLITYEDDPFGSFNPSKWDRDYKLVWYMDERFNPLEDKVWAFSCQPIGKEILGTKDMGYVVPDVAVQFNDHLPDLGVDANDCCPAFYDLAHECAYELDPVHQTNNKRLWVVKFTPMWRKPKEWKWLGVVTPEFTIVLNPELPKLEYDLEYLIPWHDFAFEHVWMLDRSHLKEGEPDIWAFTIQVSDELEGSKIIDYISPTVEVTYNPDLPKLHYNLEYTIPWHDLGYDHVWMLDDKHLQNGEEPIWAFKASSTAEPAGSKVIGKVSPVVSITYNEDLPKLDYKDEYIVPWHDLGYDHIWYLSTSTASDKVWAVRASICDEPVGEKEIGTVIPLFANKLDVVFISYNEPNADVNWQRVLEKAPWAKRVHGVKGIFNAHKAAAKLAKTDMFFVVDGDAWLVDEWEFNFQPGIFDRDCAYVWSSTNPVNDLTYQNGGVKLFSKSILMRKKKWTTLDMFTGIMPKIKTENAISCITTFNVDAFSTWRSAFRESVKLYTTNQMSKLTSWLESDVGQPFGSYAVSGAQCGTQFAKDNINDQSTLLKINDYDWLEQQFKNINE